MSTSPRSPEWSVSLDYKIRDEEPTDSWLASMLDALGAMHPAIGSAGPHRADFALWTTATSAPSALRTARSAVEGALREVGENQTKPVGMTVQPWEEFAAELEKPTIPELVGTKEVANMLHISSTRVGELTRAEHFPIPVARLAAGPVWVRATIDAFNDRWERKPGRPRKEHIVIADVVRFR
jgi:hypothetical protein